MTRLALLISLAILTACGYAPQAIAAATNTPKPTREATATAVPSATIGYEQTAIIAVQTSNEAVRVNAMITAEFEQRIQEQLQMTAARDAQIQEIYSWTQQAAQTGVPLTATQQAVINQRMPTEQAIKAAQMSATAEYPSLLKEASDAEQYAKWSWALYPAQVFIMVAVGLCLLGLLWYIVNRLTSPLTESEKRELEEDEQLEPQTSFRIDVHTGDGHSEIHDIPGTPEEFEELAIALTSGLRNLEINKWQREGDILKDGIKRFRSWARITKLDGKDFVIVMPNNELAPTSTFREVCRGWLRDHTLPDGFQFAQEMQPEQVERGSDPLDGLTLLPSPTERVSP